MSAPLSAASLAALLLLMTIGEALPALARYPSEGRLVSPELTSERLYLASARGEKCHERAVHSAYRLARLDCLSGIRRVGISGTGELRPAAEPPRFHRKQPAASREDAAPFH